MGDVSVVVNGSPLFGWKDPKISRTMEAISATFSMRYIDAWDFKQKNTSYSKWYVKPGDACKVYIDSDLVVTGFVDEVQASISSEDRNFSISGRDKTCDLVDCAAALEETKGFQNIDLAQVARTVLKPYGISLIVNTSVGKKFPQVTTEHGQTVFDLLDGLAKQRAVLLTTDINGNLVITKPGAKQALASLEEGFNIEAGEFSLDYKKRFSKYVTYGQNFGDSRFFGTGATQTKPKDFATDPTITRYRPRVIIAERDATGEEVKKLAHWEASHAAAKSVNLRLTVPGWRQGANKKDPLWEINMLTHVTSASLGISGEMLIESVSFSLSETGGEMTELVLTKPDAWVPSPVVTKDTSQFINVPIPITTKK